MAGSLYKRGETWWARISYRGKEHRQSLETTSERAARERLVKFVSDVREGRWGSTKRHTFDETANRFIDVHFQRIKSNSAKRYRVSLLNLLDKLDIKFIDEINASKLTDFESARRKDKVTTGTIRRDLACLSALLSYAVDWKWVGENAAAEYLAKGKRRGLVEAEPRHRYLSHAEEDALMEFAAERRKTARGHRDIHAYQMQEAAFAFAMDTGLRDEEQFTLTWPQVDLDQREVQVSSRVAKSSKMRRVPLFDRTIRLLSELPRHNSSKFVFWCRSGQRYSQMYVPLVRALAQIGVTGVEWHDLRRTCGVRLLRDHRFDMARVSLWLGHSSIAVTEKVYAFLEADDLHTAVSESPLVNGHAQNTAQTIDR